MEPTSAALFTLLILYLPSDPGRPNVGSGVSVPNLSAETCRETAATVSVARRWQVAPHFVLCIPQGERR